MSRTGKPALERFLDARRAEFSPFPERDLRLPPPGWRDTLGRERAEFLDDAALVDELPDEPPPGYARPS